MPTARSRAPTALISRAVDVGTSPSGPVRPHGLPSHRGRIMMAAL
ncbi:hypothetical protein [Streptomyces sp. LKA04]